MYAYISSSRGFGAAWFFISFMCIASVLIMNVCVGIVLDGITTLLRAIRKRKLLERQLMRTNTIAKRARVNAAARAAAAADAAQS